VDLEKISAAGNPCARHLPAVLESGETPSTRMPDATIHTIGKVLENPVPVLYRVELPNGKIILAHLSKPLTVAKAVFSVGDRVVLELTPYDFDQARILGLAE
jgi:translation initiation factor IF-1